MNTRWPYWIGIVALGLAAACEPVAIPQRTMSATKMDQPGTSMTATDGGVTTKTTPYDNSPACNHANGLGCRCDLTTPCPEPTDDCVALTDASGKIESGFYCRHNCDPKVLFDPTCQYPGPGTGHCAYFEDTHTDAGVSASQGICEIGCANTNPQCPQGFIPITQTSPQGLKDCYCVPPFTSQ